MGLHADGVEQHHHRGQVLLVTSDPGVTPLTVGNQVLEVDQAPDATSPTTVPGVLLPAGEYLVGITRSATADDSIPVDIVLPISVAAGTPLPPGGDVEPNDDATTATPISDALALSGDLDGSQDFYRWTTSGLAPGKAWDLSLVGPLDAGTQLYLQDTDGSTLASVVGRRPWSRRARRPGAARRRSRAA